MAICDKGHFGCGLSGMLRHVLVIKTKQQRGRALKKSRPSPPPPICFLRVAFVAHQFAPFFCVLPFSVSSTPWPGKLCVSSEVARRTSDPCAPCPCGCGPCRAGRRLSARLSGGDGGLAGRGEGRGLTKNCAPLQARREST